MNLSFNAETNSSPKPSYIDTVKTGTKLLLEEFSFPNTDCLCVQVTFTQTDTLKISKCGNSCLISCREPAHYFRALNYLLHHIQEDFEKQETVFFNKNGFMLDCSRNAVAAVSSVKAFIRLLARLGMNQLLLYTEDTYEVPGLPYFGTYRGRYSQKELRELDIYADHFGIELVPCIQTLAHLKNALKWPMGNDIKDTSDILKVGSEKVYDFVEQLLSSLKDCFSTRNIHIGMDEAAMLGLGNYLKENGYTQSSLLIKKHSARILEICKKLGWKPMMWSDMYITSNTGKGYYSPDENTDTSSWEKPDKELGLVYWDYYNTERHVYKNMLRVHHELADRVIFAGGVWNWNGISPNYGKAFFCTQLGLQEARQQKIREVFATGWMDNGAETPLEAIYPGLAAFAFLCFHTELNLEAFAEFFRDCTDAELEDFYLLDKFDSLFQGHGKNLSTDNPSKYLLYQDSMLGMFDYHIQNVDTQAYYTQLADELKNCKNTSPKYSDLFSYYHLLALVLSEKADLGLRMKAAYDTHDLSTLGNIASEVIPNILNNFQPMHMLREKLWMNAAKPFGYEILDIKLSGVSARLQSCKRRLTAYLNGDIDRLEELEQDRLPYWPVKPEYPHDLKDILNENRWDKIISGCNLVDTI